MNTLVIKVAFGLLLCLCAKGTPEEEIPLEELEREARSFEASDTVFYGDYPIAAASSQRVSSIQLPKGFHVQEGKDGSRRNKVRLIYIPVSQLEPQLRNILEGGETSLDSLTKLNPADIDVYHLPAGADEVQLVEEPRTLRRVPSGNPRASKEIDINFLKSFLPPGSTILRVRAYKGILPPNLNADTLKSAQVKLLKPQDLESKQTTRTPSTAVPSSFPPPSFPASPFPGPTIFPQSPTPFPGQPTVLLGPTPHLSGPPPVSIFSPSFVPPPITSPFPTNVPFPPYPTVNPQQLSSPQPGTSLKLPRLPPTTFLPNVVTHPKLKVPVKSSSGSKVTRRPSVFKQTVSPPPLLIDNNELPPLDNKENPRSQRKIPRPLGVNKQNKPQPPPQASVDLTEEELVLVVDIDHINPGQTAALMVDSRVSDFPGQRELPQVFISPPDYPLPPGYSKISIRYPPQADLPVYDPSQKARKLPPAYLAKPNHVAPIGYIKILLPAHFVRGANLKELIRKAAFPFIGDEAPRSQRKVPGTQTEKHKVLKPQVTHTQKPRPVTRFPSTPLPTRFPPPPRPPLFPNNAPLNIFPPQQVSNRPRFPATFQRPPIPPRPIVPIPRPPAPIPNFQPTVPQPPQGFVPLPIPKPPRTYFVSSTPPVPDITDTTESQETVTPRTYLASRPNLLPNTIPSSTVIVTEPETEVPVTELPSTTQPRLPGFKQQFRPPIFSRPFGFPTLRPEREQSEIRNINSLEKGRRPSFGPTRRPALQPLESPDNNRDNLPNAFIGPADQKPPQGYIKIPLPPTSIEFDDTTSTVPQTTPPPKITTYRPGNKRYSPPEPKSTTPTTTTEAVTRTTTSKYKNLFQRPRQRIPGLNRFNNRRPTTSAPDVTTRRFKRPHTVSIKSAKPSIRTQAPRQRQPTETATLFPPFHIAVQKYKERVKEESTPTGDTPGVVEFGARLNPKSKKTKHRKKASGKSDLVLSGSENIEQLLTQEREKSPQRLEDDEPVVYGIEEDKYSPLNLQGPFYESEKPKEDMYVVYAEEMPDKEQKKQDNFRGNRKFQYPSYTVREQNTRVEQDSKKRTPVADSDFDIQTEEPVDQYSDNYEYYDDQAQDKNEESYLGTEEKEDPTYYEYDQENYDYAYDTDPHNYDYYYDDYEQYPPNEDNKNETSTDAPFTQTEVTSPTVTTLGIQTEPPTLPLTTTEAPEKHKPEEEEDVNDLESKKSGKVLGISTATEISHKARVCFNGRCVELET